jgi:WD40 repeat protein
MTCMLFFLLMAIIAVVSFAYAKTNWALGREAAQRGRAEQEAIRNWNLAYAADMQVAGQLWENEPTSARPVANLLQAYLPGPGEQDPREFSWYYQHRLLHDARELHLDQSVQVVALSPDCHVLTAGSSFQSRDKTTGRLAWQRLFPNASYWWTDFTCDGKLAALGTQEGRVFLYDTGNGQEKPFLDGLGEIKDIGFSPRGEALAAIQSDGQTRAWEVPSGKELATFGVSQTSRFCFLSPDAQTLVIAPYPNHNELSIYRFGENEPLIKSARNFTLGAVAYSPDGRTFASGDSNGWVDLWDAATCQVRSSLAPHGSDIHALAFSSNGKFLASGTRDGLITVWNVATRRPWTHLKGHTGMIRSLGFAEDGRSLVSLSDDGTVRIWDLPPHPEAKILSKENGFGRTAFSPDGRWLAAAGEQTPIWDARTHRLVRRVEKSVALAFSPDSKILATGSEDSFVRLWNPSTGGLLRAFPVCPDLQGHPPHGQIAALAFSPNGRWLAAGLGGFNWFEGNYQQVVKVWEVDTGSVVAELRHENTVPALAFSPDGQILATSCHDHRLRLWDVNSWKERYRWKGDVEFDALAFVPDSPLLVTGNHKGIMELWDTATCEFLRTLGQHPNSLRSLALSPDGKTVASTSTDHTVKLWSMASGRELRAFRGNTNWASGVAFAVDSTALVASYDDGTVRLWDTLTPWQRMEHARSALQDNVASGMESAEVHNQLGLVHHQLGHDNQAVAEFSKALDLDPILVPALRQRALAYVRQGELEKAAADFVRLIEVVPQEHFYCYQGAPLSLLLGDTEGYRRVCREMLTRFGNTDKPWIAERVVKTCSLAPDAVNDFGPVLKLANQAITGTEKNSDYRWYLLAMGLAEYRACHYADAVDLLNRFRPQIDGIPYDAEALAVLAMAKHLLVEGHKEGQRPETPGIGGLAPGRLKISGAIVALAPDANRLTPQEALSHAQVILSKKMPDPKAGRPFGGDFHDWLHARILTNEAKALIGQAKNIPNP